MAMLTIVGIALFLGFLTLGTWQVQRRTWKLDLMARVEQRVHQAPGAVPAESEWPEITAASHEYLPVQAQGQWLLGKSVLTKALTELGSGYWLMTPLQLGDGQQIIINRGFVPDEQRGQWLQIIADATATPSGAAHIAGLLRVSEPGGGFLRHNDPAGQQWFSRDIAAIAHNQSLAHPAPYFIDLGLPAANPAHQPIPDTWPRTGLTVIRFHNSHLVYAITWYTLAAMVIGAAWLVRRHDRQTAG